jgi:hypothetical protein
MKFKLSTMLAIAALLAILFGLGYQLFTLQQELRQLRSEVQFLKQKDNGIDFTGRLRANNQVEWTAEGFSAGVQSLPKSVGQSTSESVLDGSFSAPSIR